MPKTAQGSLLSVALMSALVGLAGCHISFSSGSGSQSPNSATRAKPAKKSPSKAATSSRTSKPIDSKPVSSSKPAEEPAPAKTTTDPERTKPTDPQRKKTSDPQRTQPTDAPAPTRNHVGRGRSDDGGTSPGASGTSRPGSVTTTKTDGGAERTRLTTVAAPN